MVDATGRDRGLRRVSRLTRWSLGGALALTGVLSALVAHARPGRTSSSSSRATGPTTLPDPGNDFLRPPTGGAPDVGRSGFVVTSGAT